MVNNGLFTIAWQITPLKSEYIAGILIQNIETVTVIFYFMIFFPITFTEAVYSLEKAEKMKNLSVIVIELKFLILIL